MINKTIGVIGCGNMGSELIKRLSGAVRRGRLMVYDADSARRNAMRRYKAVIAKDNIALAKQCGVIILAVKPKDIEGLLGRIRSFITKDKLVISIAAGITTGYIERSLWGRAAVVRAMPNMPARIGEGISTLSRGTFAKRGDLNMAKKLVSFLGDVIEVDEASVDAVTAVSGSGPAYFFYLVESMIETAVELGLSRKVAKRLVIKTALGSAKLLLAVKEGPAELMAKVASKGGTTEAALHIFESRDFKGIVKEAVKRAHGRSKELSRS